MRKNKTDNTIVETNSFFSRPRLVMKTFPPPPPPKTLESPPPRFCIKITAINETAITNCKIFTISIYILCHDFQFEAIYFLTATSSTTLAITSLLFSAKSAKIFLSNSTLLTFKALINFE